MLHPARVFPKTLKVVEVAVLQLACIAVDDQQARAITRLGGGLRDQLGWEVVVEFVDSHEEAERG